MKLTTLLIQKNISALTGLSIFVASDLEGWFGNGLQDPWGLVRVTLATLICASSIGWKWPQIKPMIFAISLPMASLVVWWVMQSLLALSNPVEILQSIGISVFVTPFALLIYWQGFVAAMIGLTLVEFLFQRWSLARILGSQLPH